MSPPVEDTSRFRIGQAAIQSGCGSPIPVLERLTFGRWRRSPTRFSVASRWSSSRASWHRQDALVPHCAQRLLARRFSVISDPRARRFAKQLLEDFGVISKDRSGSASRVVDLVEALHAFLSLVPIQSRRRDRRRAQHLQPDVLEQIRLLDDR